MLRRAARWKKGRSRIQSNGLVIAPTEQRAGHLQVLTLVPQFGDYGLYGMLN